MPDQIDMSSTAEPQIRRVVVDICESCLDGAAGQCHAPGCLFCRFHIEGVPQPLRYLVTIPLVFNNGDTIPAGARAVIGARSAVDWHEGQRVLILGREVGTVRKIIPRQLVVELDSAPGNPNPFSETVVTPLDRS